MKCLTQELQLMINSVYNFWPQAVAYRSATWDDDFSTKCLGGSRLMGTVFSITSLPHLLFVSEGQNLCVTFFQTDGLCKNEGECRPSCDEPPFYECACTSEWEGHNCTIKVLNYFQLLWADLVLTQGTLRKVLHLSISLLRYLLCLLLTSWDVMGLSKLWRHI